MARTKFTHSVTVDRGRWLHGGITKAVSNRAKVERHEPLSSSLYDNASKLQCCLGFGMRQAGAAVSQICDMNFPSDITLTNNLDSEFCALLCELEESASETNDQQDLSNSVREQSLIDIFAAKGVRLSFVGRSALAVKKALRAYKEHLEP